MDFLAFILMLLMYLPALVWGHARLMSPPSRSSMWRLGFATKKNFNDNALYCGGITIQWQKNAGKCGLCGDPYDMPYPRDNEAGGKYGRGIISKKYLSGQVIEVTVDVTTNHRGYFEFKLCPNNNPKKEATQECLDKYVLKEAHGIGTRYYIGDKGNGDITVKLQLPKGLTCSQCVFQWNYIAGNNWGKCADGVSRLGCGPQETFRGCADIAIEKSTDVFNVKHNENDVGNKPHKVHQHKIKKQGHQKEATENRHPLYEVTYEVTKHSRKHSNRTHASEYRNYTEGHNRFHHKNGDHLPSSKKPGNTTKPRSFAHERRRDGVVNKRKYHKFDNRHFHHQSNHPSYLQSPPGKDAAVGNSRLPVRNEQNDYAHANWPRYPRKRYNTGLRGRYPQRQMDLIMSSDSDEDDTLLELLQGFNLGGRRYKDFWFL